ncbi:hypothetical protein ULG90_01280 [Halopseudomonas pachastrellae]|nr:hypothetical protein ULG90_01280 [Halopseudomonas pachastrellae]
MKISIIVVLYKQKTAESQTLLSLEKNQGHQLTGTLHLWDNSPTNISSCDAPHLSIDGFTTDYSWHPENTPLSRVYNQVSEKLEDSKFLIILDQDSDLPTDFLKKIEYSIKRRPDINLFLPKVHNGEKLVSPGKLLLFKGRHIADISSGVHASKNMLAISSGMVISHAYLKNYRFDERLTLYGIDTRFMIDYSETEKSLFVMPVTVNHSTALWSSNDPPLCDPASKT